MKPSLLVLAAGMGSRYGGLKQLDGIGPHGETIMDYSIYDAAKAGFAKVVFVIRHDFEKEFNQHVLAKYTNSIPCELCFQAVDKIPYGYTIPAERTKPWGTNHAVMMGQEKINEPFAVINSDDFYGRDAFNTLYNYLNTLTASTDQYCMVGYPIQNTLSENGTVNRGVCHMNDKQQLTDITETKGIEKNNKTIRYKNENGQYDTIPPNTTVSMNMWGFTPDYFDYSHSAFKEFLKEHGHEPQSEFYIPTLVNQLIKENKITCQVLTTTAQWFGVTYANDKPKVIEHINRLIQEGVYPDTLL